jgi:hypothetical protein
MKTVITILLFFQSQLIWSQEQEPKRNSYYLGTKVGIGTTKNIHIDLNFVNKSKYSFSVFYLFQTTKADSVPSDFDPGLIIYDDCLELEYPQEKMNCIGFTIGKSGTFFSDYLNIGCKLGILFGHYREPTNYQEIPTGLIGENYTWELTKRETLVGLIINPEIKFYPTKYFGFSVGGLFNVNKTMPSVAFEFGVVAGLLRNEIPK